MFSLFLAAFSAPPEITIVIFVALSIQPQKANKKFTLKHEDSILETVYPDQGKTKKIIQVFL